MLFFGQNNTYQLSPNERQIPIDSTHITLSQAIHNMGRVQFPINRVVQNNAFITLINLALPSDHKNLVINQTNANKDIIQQKEGAYLLRVDSNYVVRRFFECTGQNQLFEFNLISSDSILAIEQYEHISQAVDDRIECQGR